MGAPVVPLLLTELRRKPGFWFVALRDTARDEVLATYPAEAVRRGLPGAAP